MLSVTCTANWYLNTIELHANFINLKAEVVQSLMLSDGVYRFNIISCANFQVANSSGTTVLQQLIPFKYSSLKCIFVGFRPQVSLTTGNYPLNNRFSYNIYDFTTLSFLLLSILLRWYNISKCQSKMLSKLH